VLDRRPKLALALNVNKAELHKTGRILEEILDEI
jgi:hypothetical protein